MSPAPPGRGPGRVPPGPGQESVWDYPRPPSADLVRRRVQITVRGRLIADAAQVWRVCETSHPPTYYLDPAAFAPGVLVPASGSSVCEYKGVARYWDVAGVERAGWSYDDPSPGYEAMAGTVAVYPGRMDEVRLDGELVRPQVGGFYGGWITDEVVGPFKGEPGTAFW